MLLWKALDENPTFLGHVLTSCDVTAVSIQTYFGSSSIVIGTSG